MKTKEEKANGCFLCGYNKCIAALDLHHCVVLCANCHREVHYADLIYADLIVANIDKGI